MAPKVTGWLTARELFDLLDVGDRVKFDRTPYGITHWGIVVARNEEDRSAVIIHYTRRPGAILKGVVREDKLEDVANGDMCAVDNSLDNRYTPYSPATIVHGARSRLGEPMYNLFASNCEHFASWCRNGIHHSDQADPLDKVFAWFHKYSECFRSDVPRQQ